MNGAERHIDKLLLVLLLCLLGTFIHHFGHEQGKQAETLVIWAEQLAATVLGALILLIQGRGRRPPTNGNGNSLPPPTPKA